MKTYEEALHVAVPIGMDKALDNADRYREMISEIEHNPKTIELLNSLFVCTEKTLQEYPDDCGHCIWIKTLRSALFLGLVCGIEMEKGE